MRRITSLAAVGLLVSLALVTLAHAITFGENDNGRHPFVGSLVVDNGQKVQGCSGTLVSPTVFVSAGHCLFAVEQDPRVTGVWVSFDDVIDADADFVVDASVTLHSGTVHVHPDFGFPGVGGNLADPHDVAVFVLDAPVAMANYGQLPTAGLLETINKLATRFTTVGYGIVRDDKTLSFESFELRQRRMMVTQEMQSLTAAWVQFSANPSTGSGGTCYGDSGGPHFLGAGATETRIILAVTGTGDHFCRAMEKSYRLDTPSARSFLDDFVTLP